MAQRTIHYLIGEELIPLGVRDPDRFRIGNLLPDAIADLDDRKHTHFQTEWLRDGRNVRMSDFEAFRRRFAPLVETDGLYLGYYMHLVEDACYRRFWNTARFAPRDMARGDVAVLHNDYHLLNAYIVRSRGLRNETVFPENFEREPILTLYPFRLRALLDELREDFAEEPKGTTRYLTEALLERFLSEAAGVCREALRRILAGEEPMDPHDLMW